MKKKSTQQEILLMTGTKFAAREYSERTDPDAKSSFSEIEKLEEACWNGLLPEMLPEIMVQPQNGQRMYMWSITEGASFLGIELGDTQEEKDKFYSIDPYVFLRTQQLS